MGRNECMEREKNGKAEKGRESKLKLRGKLQWEGAILITSYQWEILLTAFYDC